MKHKIIAAPPKKKRIPGWVRSSAPWLLLSNVKLAFKRIALTRPYRARGREIKTFLYFMAVEYPGVGGIGSLTFQFKGIEFDLRPMEWHLMEAILLQNEYEPIKKLFEGKTPGLIIDAGANVGMFTVYALTNWPTARIFAIEPGPDTFKLLERNQKKNPTLGWQVLSYAFWKEDGSIFFEANGLSMAAHVSEQAKGVEVRAIRLDHFIDKFLQPGERISILKMDIEGAEEAVLVASQDVLNRVDAMIIEVHPGMCNETVVRNILETEFEFIYDLSTPSTKYPVMLACRKPLANFEA